MYIWFGEVEVEVLAGMEEEEEVLLYVRVEFASDEVVLYLPVAEDVGIVNPVPEDPQPEMLVNGLDPDPDPDVSFADPEPALVEATLVSAAVTGHQATVW
jgi:hypothetical protein